MDKVSNGPKRKGWRLLAYCALSVSLAALFLVQPRVPNAAGRLVLSVVFTAAVLLVLAAVAVLMALRWMRELGYYSRGYRIIGVTLLALFAAGALLLYLFYSGEKDIRVYDFSAYWVRLLEAREMAADSLTGLAGTLLSSLASDYTYVATLPLIPLSYLFGTGYFGYVLSIFLVYCLPACFFLALFAMRLIHLKRNVRPSTVTFSVCIAFGAILPGFIWPVLNGYIDIAGVLLMALMMNVALHWNGSVFSIKHILALSALSLVLLLTRRWFAFYIIGFYVSLGIDLLLSMVRRRKFIPKELGLFILNMGLVAALSSILILLLNRNVFAAFLSGHYASAYSVYKTLPWWQNLWQLIQSWGLLWLLAALAGFVILLFGNKTRILCIRMLAAAALGFALFSVVQNLDMHHFYLVTPTLFVFVCVFCDATVQFMKTNRAPIFLIVLACINLVNFTLAFVPAAGGLYNAAIPFTTVIQRYPKVYEYYGTVRQVTNDLREKMAGTSGLVYVVGASDALSTELLKRADLPDEIDGAPFVMYNHIVDLRDGFPSQFFLADYVVLEDPYAEGFETTQQVGYQIYDMLMNDARVSPYYQLDESYRAGDNNIRVFKKVLPAGQDLVNNLKDRLMAFYPDDPFVYEPNYLIALFDYDRSLAVEYDYWSKNFAFRHDGSRALTMGWQDTASFTRLQFTMQTETTAMELTVQNQQGELRSTRLEAHAWESVDLDITGSEFILVTVAPITKGEESSGDLTFIINLNEGALQ